MNRIDDLVTWLGPEGAIAGIEASDLTIQEISAFDAKFNPPSSKMKRGDLIRALVAAARERLTKSPEELMSMDVESLKTYLHSIKASREEILGLLLKLDIRPSSSARQSLVDFAAREISEIGMYRRVAQGEHKD